ncbi:MAG: cyclase family protein [Vicingaceae bacterium]
MKAIVEYNNKELEFDLTKPMDVSMSLRNEKSAASAWYVPPVSINPVKSDQFTGDVNQGGSVNFNDIAFNPHGNGTHTEGFGHISPGRESVNDCLKKYHFVARLVSVLPETRGYDRVISRKNLEDVLKDPCQALLIRTLPNSDEKLQRQYSNSNPPYLEVSAVDHILEKGVEHLLIDLPSVDREMDEGKLLAHRRFWNYPQDPAIHRTITELIYVPGSIPDGMYLVNIQLSPLENDASPSRPVLYPLISQL